MSFEAQNYNGELLPAATRRLAKEQASLAKDSLESQGIFYQFDENQNHKAVALILGPSGTPYAFGFYLFQFTFPNDYPLRPPQVQFCTGDGRVRFNPNLYVGGKVCLSILGTWEGPSWTQLCSFRTTLLSIQSLLCAHPIQNEPGHEKSKGSDCRLYSAILRYENVSVAALRMATNLPDVFSPFRTTIRALFLHHYNDYLEVLAEFEGCEGKKDRSPIFNFIVKYSPSSVKKQLVEARDCFLQDVDIVAEFERIAPFAAGANFAVPNSMNSSQVCDSLANSPSAATSEAPLLQPPPPVRHVARGLRISQSCCRLFRRCRRCLVRCVCCLNPQNLCSWIQAQMT